MKRALLAVAALLLATPVSMAAEPFSLDESAVVYVDCGMKSGTAVRIGPTEYVTAAHVVTDDVCRVNGEVIHPRIDGSQDFATFSGPRGKYLKKYCRDFAKDETYLAVGYAMGAPFLTSTPLMATEMKSGGMRVFVGETIPGQSGGPVIDRSGRVVGIVNMRWPARSVPLRNTSVC